MARDPFFGTNPVVDALERRRGYIEQLRQNTSRLAQSYNVVVTTGTGMLKLKTVVTFACTFVEQPYVSYGYVLGSDLIEGDYPSSSGGVYEYQTDERGFYIGAWVFAVVTAVEDYPSITHNFTFTGIAMKDLPDYLLDV